MPVFHCLLLPMVLHAAVGPLLEAQTPAWGERVFGGITDWPEQEMDRVLVLTSGALARGLEPAGAGFCCRVAAGVAQAA